MARAKSIGTGWHGQKIRHSNARRLGRAGGRYATALAQGTKIESEHSKTINFIQNNPSLTTKQAEEKIAKDHLAEDPNYYAKLKKIEEKPRYEISTTQLQSRYSKEKSFYGKAKVINYSNGDKTLRSYTTDVAEIKNGKLTINGTYSDTTTRHIKEFAKQNGFFIEDTKQMMKEYGKK